MNKLIPVTKLKIGSKFTHPDYADTYCTVQTIRFGINSVSMTCYYRTISTNKCHRAHAYKMFYANTTIVERRK